MVARASIRLSNEHWSPECGVRSRVCSFCFAKFSIDALCRRFCYCLCNLDVLPELVHDTYFGASSPIPNPVQKNTSVAQTFLSANTSRNTSANTSTNTFTAAAQVLPRRVASSPSGGWGVHDANDAIVSSDTAHSRNSHNNSSLSSLATNDVQHPPQSVQSLVFKQESSEQKSSQQSGLSDAASAQTLASVPLPSEAAQERTFWKRLSIDARVTTRTEIASAQASMLSPTFDAANFNTQRQFAADAASPLQNIAIGVMYALDNHQSIGIEGGTEPFLSVIPATGFAGGRPQTTMPPDITTTSTPSSMPSTTRTQQNNEMLLAQRTPTLEARNRAWFGAAYQYTLPMIEVLGGVQPLARVTLGGGEIGVVSRALLGARFLPENQVSVLLAGEGAGIARQNALSPTSAWDFVPRLGMTLGLSVKF